MARKKSRTRKSRNSPQKKIKKKEKVLQLFPGEESSFSNPFEETEAPEGFRGLSIAHAMMKISDELYTILGIDNEDENAMTFAMNLASMLWNYLEAGDSKNKDEENEIREVIETHLKISKKAADKYFRKAIDRISYLIPPDIQPKNSVNVFFRKGKQINIEKYPFEEIDLSKKVKISEQDKIFIKDLKKLDKYVLEEAPYSEYEDLLLQLKKDLRRNLEKWLNAKAVDKKIYDLVLKSEPAFEFIYSGNHLVPVCFSTLTLENIEDYMFDFVVRKSGAEPSEFPAFLAAFKLIFVYLNEIKYMKAKEILQNINFFENVFIDIIQKEYG